MTVRTFDLLTRASTRIARRVDFVIRRYGEMDGAWYYSQVCDFDPETDGDIDLYLARFNVKTLMADRQRQLEGRDER